MLTTIKHAVGTTRWVYFGTRVVVWLTIAALISGSLQPLPAQAGLAQASLASPDAAAVSPQVRLSSAVVHLGGTIMVSAVGLQPNTSYAVGLTDGRSLRAGYQWVASDAGGSLYARLTAAENASPEATAVGVGLASDNVAASAFLGILAAYGMVIEPTSGKPGAVIDLTITNLEQGTLRVDLDGQPVIGPLVVPAGTYVGSFTVPLHGASAIPAADLVVTNLTGQGVIGRSRSRFDIVAPDTAVPPVVSGLAVLPDPLMPGETFTLTGRIWPLPAELAVLSARKDASAVSAMQSSLAVSLVDPVTLEKAPVSTQVVSLDSQGYFLAEGVAPSKQFGSTVLMGSLSKMEVKVIGKAFSAAQALEFGGPMDLNLYIATVDSGGLPVSVKTTLTEIPELQSGSKAQVLAAATGAAYAMQEMFCNKEGWVHQTLPGTGLANYNGAEAGIPIVLNPVSEMLQSSALFGEAPVVEEVINPGIVVPHDPQLRPWGVPNYTIPSAFNPYDFTDSAGWTKYLAYADGRATNYTGLIKGQPWQTGQPLVVYRQTVWFHREVTAEYPYGVYNALGEWLDLNTLTYTFQYVAPSDVPAEMGIQMDQAVDLGKAEINGKSLHVFGGFFHLAPVAGDPSITYTNFPTILRFYFAWDIVKYDELQKEVAISLDGVPMGTAQMTGGLGASLCGTISKAPAEVDLSLYQLEIVYPINLSPGIRSLAITFHKKDGTTFIREIGLRSDALPSWFLVGANFSARAIVYDGVDHTVSFGGKQLNPTDDTYGAGTGEASGQVDGVGSVQNQVNASTYLTQVYFPAQTLEYEAYFDAVTATIGAPNTQALSNQPTSPSVKGSASDSIHIDTPPIPLAYIIMPLYVIAFEDPFGGAIVNGTSGAVMEAYATMTIVGDISPSTVDMTLYPYARVNLHIWLNIQVLYGILGKAEMALLPTFELEMPVKFHSPKPAGETSSISIEGVCFAFRGDVFFFFGFLCAPVLGCAVKHKGTVNLYNGAYPSGCTIASNAPMVASELQPYGLFPPTRTEKLLPAPPEPVEPLMTHVDLFTTGSGHPAYVSEATAGSLKVSQFIGGVWKTPVEIENSRTNDSAVIAPLSASRHLAVWAASSYTNPVDLQAQLIEVGAQSMNVKSKLLNGAEPMLPVAAAVTVTPPNSGDGQIALGSCPEEQTGCPAGGKVTAAWLRLKTPGAKIGLGGLRVVYATYTGATTTWGAEVLVPQPAGASDSQAQVLYSKTGVLAIYFVRDLDGNMNTSADRRLYVYTPGDLTAAEVDGMPDSIYEYSLAFAADGDLHIAFTRVEGTNVGLIDNRHPLYVGQAAGSLFSTNIVRDQHQRAIFAESPSLQFSGLGEAVLTYRGMGMGPDGAGLYTPYLSDSLGVIYRTGDMAQFNVNFSQEIQYPTYLTLDGAVNWSIDSTLDMITGKVISTSIKTAALALTGQPGVKAAAQALSYPSAAQAQPLAAAEDTGILIAVTTDQPQFAVEAVEGINPTFQSAGGVYVNVTIRNQGAAFAGTGVNGLRVVAAWDAPYGQGSVAGQGVLESLGAGAAVIFPLALTLPTSPDLAHTLYVTLAPPSSVQESTLDDNDASLTMGGIPAPQQVLASLQTLNNHAAMVTWYVVSDVRVVGYRVYRAPASGAKAGVFTLLGVTPTLDWQDLTTVPGQAYLYAVSAVGSSGAESLLSQTAAANVPYDAIYLPAVKK